MKKATQDRRQSRLRWTVNLILLICASIIFSSLLLLFSTNRRVFSKHFPLIQTVYDIQCRMLEAHLWFEEAISGDTTVKLEEIQDLLNQADRDIRALLDGGTTRLGTIEPVQYPLLRDNFKQIHLLSGELRQITKQRWENISTSGTGSEIDQQYDGLFKELLASANNACNDIDEIILRETIAYKRSTGVLLGTSSAILLAISVLINYFLSYQYKSNQKLFSVNQQLEANEQQLRASNQQLTASEQQLKSGNQQLRASEQQLQAVNQQLTANEAELKRLARFPSENPNPVLRILDDGTISYYNRASKPLLDAWQCSHHDKLAEPWLGFVMQAFDSEEPIQMEVDCEDRIFLVTFSPIAEMNYVNLYATDITQRKQAEKSLKSSLSMLTAALESTADGILIVDGRGKIEQWNQKFVEMWQIPKKIISTKDDDAAIGHVLSQLTDPEQFIDKVRALYTQPDASSFDQLDFKDGRVFERYSQPQKIGEIVVGRVWSFRDVTERRLAEQEREKLMHKLRSKNEELQSIVYISSHDLRSPLVNINGFSDLLTQHINRLKSLLKSGAEENRSELTELLEGHIPEDIEFIAHGTKKMELLINGLLQVSRVGTTAVNPVEFDMNDVVDTIIDNVTYKAKQREAVITRDDLCPCYGNPVQINQVFSNLIDNALKYCDLSRKTHIHVSCVHNNSNAVYCVHDNGIGIANDQHEKVFNIFYRFDPEHVAEGEGLGLTIVRRILDHHSGRIWIESTPGEGSKFFISLPRKEAL